MNETLLWLLYLVSAAVAFVSRPEARLADRAVDLGGTGHDHRLALIYPFTGEEKRPDFWRVDLSLNASFALIFAGAARRWLAMQHRRATD